MNKFDLITISVSNVITLTGAVENYLKEREFSYAKFRRRE